MSTFVTAQIYIFWICYFQTHVFPELKVLLCREGYFLLPYNELAIAQGPKIQQKNKL